MEPESGGAYKKIAQSIVGPFEPLITMGLGAVVKWVVVQGPAVLRAAAAMCFIIFILGAAWFWYGFSGMEDLFLKGMAAKLENSNQSRPGIEAMVLSGLPVGLPNSVKQLTLSDEFIKNFEAFNNNLATAAQDDIATLAVHQVGQGGSLFDKYFIEGPSQSDKVHGFLFIPAILIPQRELTSPNPSDNDLIQKLWSDADLAADVRVSSAIAQSICSFTNGSLFVETDSPVESQPVQAYFITARGVTTICEGKTQDQRSYYVDQFEPTTFFPARSYFKNSINVGHPLLTTNSTELEKRISAAFTLTDPYIDLGGNGLVITGCRAMSTTGQITNMRDSILCLDLPLGQSQLDAVKSRVYRVGGTPIDVSCWSAPSVRCNGDPPWNAKLVLRVNELAHKSLLSDLFGKIQVIDQTKTTIGFTVPIQQEFGQNGRAGKLLYCYVDLGKIQWRHLMKGAAVGGSFFLFVIFVVLLIADYGARINEQDRAFRTVAGVMQDAPAPYIRLNSDDRFLEFNEAFALLIGYSTLLAAKLELQEKTFEDLLADQESRKTYEQIDQCRRDGKPTGNYQINLKSVNGSAVKVVVHGAAVPNPTNPRGKVPQTFGIIIPVKSEPRPVTEIPRRDATGTE